MTMILKTFVVMMIMMTMTMLMTAAVMMILMTMTMLMTAAVMMIMMTMTLVIIEDNGVDDIGELDKKKTLK